MKRSALRAAELTLQSFQAIRPQMQRTLQRQAHRAVELVRVVDDARRRLLGVDNGKSRVDGIGAPCCAPREAARRVYKRRALGQAMLHRLERPDRAVEL